MRTPPTNAGAPSLKRYAAKAVTALLCVCAVANALSIQEALAISDADLNSVLGRSALYDPTNNCTATVTTGVGAGTLPPSVPSTYNGVFTDAANAYNVPPAFLAALFYAGEHGGTLPVTASQWPNAAGPWADSGQPSPGAADWPGGVHHGAAGPFQFEYPTWQKYAVDGNKDGQKDVENLVDAAHSSANYLASLGANTADAAKLHQAAYSYNGSGSAATTYADKVMAAYQVFGGGKATGMIQNPFIPTAYADSTPPGPTGGGTDTLNGYKLPATKGGTGIEQHFPSYALGSPKTPDEDKYYITMRWTYTKWNWDGTNTSADGAQLSYLTSNHPRLIVTNPTTHKSMIADALESGPAPWTGVDSSSNNNPKQGWTNPQDGTPSTYRGRVSGFVPEGLAVLGATQRMADGTGDDLLYAWDDNQSDPLGPTTKTVTGLNPNPSGNCGAQAAGSVDGATILSLATAEFNKHPTSFDATVLGYTDGASEPWCADFISWIFKQAGHPLGTGSNWKIPLAIDMMKWFQQNGTWVANQPGAPPPQPGDVYYTSHALGGTGDHVGIVDSVSGNDLKTINGNWGGTINYQTYPSYQQDATITGWGRLK